MPRPRETAPTGNREPRRRPTPTPEVDGGLVAQRLERLRARLLDLSNRNRLLNFKHSSASTLRFVDARLDEVFLGLSDGATFSFEAVPDPPASDGRTGDVEGNIQPPSATDFASTLGWATKFDLQEEVGPVLGKRSLRVLHFGAQLEAITRKIATAARTSIEESGTNTLHISLGFLEWYESDDSREAKIAPLLSVPVAMERAGKKTGPIEARIEYSGEDCAQNLSLIEKMRRDFDLDIPQFEHEELPSVYLARVRSAVSSKRAWRVRPFASLALLGFGKLLMYRDLDPKVWPEVSAHSVVKTLFEGTRRESVAICEDLTIDDRHVTKTVPPLVIDADSSQHSALVDVQNGKNLVIEGPPGTGKSQTITNLIAAALQRNQTVLFVSEKLAALEVVRRRLDGVGLGQFCLELHSHKTRKDALLKDLAGRLRAQGTFREPSALDRLTAELERKKSSLNRYVELVHKRLEPSNLSVYEVLWKRDWSSRNLPLPIEQLEKVRMPAVLKMDQDALEASESLVAQFATHCQEVRATCKNPTEHEWAWITSEIEFADQMRILDELQILCDSAGQAAEECAALQAQTGIVLESTLQCVKNVTSAIKALPETEWGDRAPLLPALRRPEARQLLSRYRTLASGVASLRVPLASTMTTVDESAGLLGRDSSHRVERAVKAIAAANERDLNVKQVFEGRDRAKAARETLDEAESALMDVSAALNVSVPFAADGLSVVLTACQIIDSAPAVAVDVRHTALVGSGVTAVLEKASAEADSLKSQRSGLEERLRIGDIESDDDVEAITRALRTVEDASWWEVLLGRQFAAARKVHRRLLQQPQRCSRAVIVADLRAARDYRRACRRLDGDERVRQICGGAFDGVDTPWNTLIELARWYVRIDDEMSGNDEAAATLRSQLLTADATQLRLLKSRLQAVAHKRRVVERLSGLLAKDGATRVPNASLKALRDRVAAKADLLESASADLGASVFRDDVTIAELESRLPDAALYRARRDELHALVKAHREVAAMADMDDQQLGELETAAAFVESMLDDRRLPPLLAEWLLSEEFDARLRGVRNQLEALLSQWKRAGAAVAKLRKLSGAEELFADRSASLRDIARDAGRRIGRKGELPAWLHYSQKKRECAKRGLAKLTAVADTGGCPPATLPQVFRFIAYDTLAQQAFSESIELYQFSGLSHEKVREEFARLDVETIALQRQRIAAGLDRRAIPHGVGAGPVGSWTDLALVMREVEKQKRHIPIRQLVARAGAALQAMKPCFMMGPLSVAQYLPPGKIEFDLIVMDEASQLKPEDAIGAIARSGQMVVVGDPKQLPPTSFFDRLVSDDELDDENLTGPEDVESILDAAAGVFQPVRRLKWHYRSKHHSLIAYSNKAFYDSSLVVFPSAYQDSADLGIKYRHVKGVFEGRRNVVEADAVVDAVMEHIASRPTETLGVVTLNFTQQELVQETLERRLRTDPFGLEYIARMEKSAEPLFVKNLENVQGDERDVVYISTTYGPDARGNQFQRFGPINRANGYRRLNVLFTRARKRTEVFCSLDTGRLVASGEAGVTALKEYLDYARTGILGGAIEAESPQPANEFERSVLDVLESAGFAGVPQVGVAGFYIDIGVRHPTRPGAFLLGVECDGATYHSAKSARDRDRLRQQILENQGWKIHRVWSTDWFRSRERESRRLLDVVERLLAGDVVHQAELKKQRESTTIRQKLEHLRDAVVVPAFPERSDEIGLLRPQMLEELLKKKPRSREEFLARVAAPLRQGTGPGQVGRFLDLVLEALRAEES